MSGQSRLVLIDDLEGRVHKKAEGASIVRKFSIFDKVIPSDLGASISYHFARNRAFRAIARLGTRTRKKTDLWVFLDGKSGIVIGAAQGFGLAAAKRLAEEGATVALVDIKVDKVSAADASLVSEDLHVIAITADFSDEDATIRMSDEAEYAFGRLYFIHQYAAIQVEKLLHETSVDEWDQLMSVKLRSMFLCAKHIPPRMMRSGGESIVNNASVLSMTADEALPVYSASKHGVLEQTRGIAITKAYAKAGIRCNCICPGDIRTSVVEQYWVAQPDPIRA